jgi:hypothetical protein
LEGLTVSWLIDSADKIPAPGPLKPGFAASEVLHFLVQPSDPSPGIRCEPLKKPVVHVIGRRRTFTIERGLAYVRYVPAVGVRSPLQAFKPDTYRALVGPLRLKFFPLDKGVDVCA